MSGEAPVAAVDEEAGIDYADLTAPLGVLFKSIDTLRHHAQRISPDFPGEPFI